MQNRHRPLLLEDSIRSPLIRQFRSVPFFAFIRIDRKLSHTATAFDRLAFLKFLRKESFEQRQQKRSEPTAFRIGSFKETPFRSVAKRTPESDRRIISRIPFPSRKTNTTATSTLCTARTTPDPPPAQSDHRPPERGSIGWLRTVDTEISPCGVKYRMSGQCQFEALKRWRRG